jgi:4-diphosphocytidyl-2-C-methyl-D-erythritol kinase
MDKINLKAPAKINLYLSVKDRRPDGYHNIDSLMQVISLYDELSLEKSNDIELYCTGLDNVKIEDNLAYKAARLIAEMSYFPGVRITLRKNIPTGAGLGGGSSDAAFVIRGLIKLYDLHLDRYELVEKVNLLGTDIPLFLGRGQARVTGIGDCIEDYFLPLNYKALIVKPPFSVKTSEAYGWLDVSREGEPPLKNTKDLFLMEKRVTASRFIHFANLFFNDFEEVVFSRHPQLNEIKQILKREGAFCVEIAGSGSAVFGLFPITYDLEKKVEKLFDTQTRVFICKPVLLAPAS